MLFRKVAIRSTPSFPRCPWFAFAGLLAAGLAASPARAAGVGRVVGVVGGGGGTIDPGDTVLLNNGATVTGNITDNGTLQFNQSAGNTLTISNTISGTGTLSLTTVSYTHLTLPTIYSV